MMVENIPFMHTLALGILDEVGRDSEKAVPTILVTYALSTIFVGILFYLLGAFRLGSVVYFVPKHIIIGAIGGIGVFVVQNGLENATGTPFHWSIECLAIYCSSAKIWLWLTTVALVWLLHILTRVFQSPFLPPLYFLSIPPVFYIVLGLSNISLDWAHECGWFFGSYLRVFTWKEM